VPAEHLEASLSQAVRELQFHSNGVLVGHGVQVLVERRHQPDTVLSDHPRGFDPCLVICEPLLRCQARHPDVVPRPAVPRGIPEEHDVDVMMAGGLAPATLPW
jgi:hypothetical protein